MLGFSSVSPGASCPVARRLQPKTSIASSDRGAGRVAPGEWQAGVVGELRVMRAGSSGPDDLIRA